MKRVCVTIFLAVFISCTLAGSDDDVAGPVVKLTRNRKTGKINAVQEGEHLPPSAPPPSVHAKTEMGQALEQKLQAEFTESTKSQFVNASELATELDKTTGEEVNKAFLAPMQASVLLMADLLLGLCSLIPLYRLK